MATARVIDFINTDQPKLSLVADDDDTFSEVDEEEEERSAEVAKAVERLRVQQEARRLFAKEQADATFYTLPRQTLADALQVERKTVPCRIEHLHRIGYNTTITAKYKTGKTTLGENMIRSLVDGVDFLDRFKVVMPSGRVGLLNYELDDNDMLDWLAKLGIKNTQNIALLNLRGRKFSLAHERNQEELIKWCTEMDVEVLHLDPHRRAFAGFGSENDNDDVNRFTETLDVIKEEAGVKDLFLYVHMGRATKDEGDEHARGATALDDWVDQRWILTKKQDTRFLYAEGRAGTVPEFGLSFDEATGRLTAVDGNRASLPSRANNRQEHQAREVGAIVRENPGQNTGWVLSRMTTTSNKDERNSALKLATGDLDLVHRVKRGREWLLYPVGDE